MDKDMIVVAIVTICAIACTLAFVYAISKNRSKKYIVFVNETGIKTSSGKSYLWNDLKRVHFINKRVMGKGLVEKNFAIEFYFTGGNAFIDLHSNIYSYLYEFAIQSPVRSTSVVTKGLIREA